jgi:hypothetical protein
VRPRQRIGLAAALALGAAACEETGPGTLAASVRAPVPTGAVVIELVGAGVTGFEGEGGTRVFAAEPLSAADTLRRVIVMSPTGAALQFRVAVEDVSQPPPRAAVVDAVDPANRKITALAGYAVRIAR